MRRRPLSGAIIGILIGLAVAVILARQGVWPTDQLSVFFLPALTGLLGMLILSIGRTNSTTTMVVSLVVLIPMLIWGALGFGEINQNGEMNGGCTVDASSSVDSTTVTDTSRSDPFEIDSDGGLTWSAVSPEAFMDYEWQLEVVVGGIPVPIESGSEANSTGDIENSGDVGDIEAYAAVRGIDLDLFVGVYEVGGSAATCDGFGFVRILDDGIDIVTIIAIVFIVLLIVLVLILFYAGRGEVTVESAEVTESSEVIDAPGEVDVDESGSPRPPDGDDRA